MLAKVRDPWMSLEQSKQHLQLLVVFHKISLMGHEREPQMVKIVHMDQKVPSPVEEDSSMVGPVLRSTGCFFNSVILIT